MSGSTDDKRLEAGNVRPDFTGLGFRVNTATEQPFVGFLRALVTDAASVG